MISFIEIQLPSIEIGLEIIRIFENRYKEEKSNHSVESLFISENE